MGNESGEWVMHGRAWDDPMRLRNHEEAIWFIEKVGFMPLFKNDIPGFSIEENSSPLFWWTDDYENDPWKWRELIARSGEVAYGKFFCHKAGFISKEWLPYFANYRRDGYDFDSLWEDELAGIRSKKIIDTFEKESEQYSFEVKKRAGFGKEGEKGFDGTISALQMQTYLVIRDFRKRRRKADGVEYGWPVSVYTTPEHLFGADLVRSAYHEDPKVSKQRIYDQIKKYYPQASEEAVLKLLG